MAIMQVLLGGLLLMAVCCANAQSGRPILPDEVLGWRWDGKEEVYDRETIFDYIDGMGEVYRAYNFRQVFVRRYEKPDQPRITVDLFDMGFPEDAFGVWSFERDGEPVGIGQGADYAVGMLRFWKGRYFVAVWAERETSEVKEAILTLGRKIAEAIAEQGQKPELLKYLPAKGLDKNRILFFRHILILNRHYFIADRDILNLSLKAEGVLATYRVGKGTMRLILVRYPTEKDAAKAQETFGRAYLREGRSRGVVRTENRKWVAAKRFGQTLAIALDAPTESQAKELIAQVSRLLSSRK
ncbi:MAG: hypothetical protein N3B10_01435 [Armatimonadetes bacterium]|nr:hypothetical protein [Armatimonadota bacterium]